MWRSLIYSLLCGSLATILLTARHAPQAEETAWEPNQTEVAPPELSTRLFRDPKLARAPAVGAAGQISPGSIVELEPVAEKESLEWPPSKRAIVRPAESESP